MRKKAKIFLLVSISFFLLSCVLNVKPNGSVTEFPDGIRVQENHLPVKESVYAVSSGLPEIDQTVAEASQENITGTIKGGHQMLQSFSESDSFLFSRHVMCKDFDPVYYTPIDPTTIFRPSDTKAVCLITVSVNSSIEFRWYYKSDSSRAWVSCYNWSTPFIVPGEYYYEGHLLIAGYWPGLHYPRAYKVEVYLDGLFAFSEFFEVTNGGLNSPRICEDVDLSGNPVNIKSRFTVNVDATAHHYLRFDKIAYFNEELGVCHNFTTVWVQPDGSTYKTCSGNFTDYKETSITWNCWQSRYVPSDYISINSSTPVGNWKVEVYLDSYYFNNTWMRYGPVAVTPFVVGNETAADWTFMVYLDGDNSLENASTDVFLKMAAVGSSSRANIVVQMDRIPGEDGRYGNWTDCKRFEVTKNMIPTPGNATQDLGEVNMGHPDTLKDFVNWTIWNYPANYYSLVLWDHGVGVMGLCFDVTNNSDFLSLPELSQALSGLPAIVDVVLIDGCSMAMTEVVYQIKDCANVLVGPEGLGYAPAPYDNYLSSLTSDPSMLPKAFATEIVSSYIRWCNSIIDIQNATMSATDLTKITSLAAAIDDFALVLKKKETPYHQQMNLARSLTQVYQGPYAGQTGYYLDLYHFVQLVYQHVIDEELRNAANQVTTMLSIGEALIAEDDKACPDSHGLSIFFPSEKEKYDSFGSVYEEADFAIDTLWDEFVKNHLSGYVLTIQTPYPDIPVKVDEESYATDAGGEIRVFVLPDSYTVNVTTHVSTQLGSRGVFTQWNDNNTSNPRTLFVNRELTLEAEYETQHRLVIDAEFGVTNPSAGEHWYEAGSSVEINATPPAVISGERYIWLGWIGRGSGSYSDTDKPAVIIINGPINETALWQHEYKLTTTSSYGSPTPMGEWFESENLINASVTSPWLGTIGIRYACTGWIGTGSVPISGTNASVAFTIEEPSTIEWNWKTQYLLTLRTDPADLSPQPTVSQLGPWYDSGMLVNCTAQKIDGYAFDHWTVDEKNWDRNINPMNVTMDRPYEATAHYMRALAWWENFLRPPMLQVIIGFGGIAVAAVLVGTAWTITRRRKALVPKRSPFLRGLTNPIYQYRVLAVLIHGRVGAENVIRDLMAHLEPQCVPVVLLGPTAPTQLSLPKEAKVGWVTTMHRVSELEYPILPPENPTMISIFLTKTLETIPEERRPVILGDFLDNMIPHMSESLFYRYYSDLTSAARVLNHTVVVILKADIHSEVKINVVKRFADVIIEYRELEEKVKLVREIRVSNRVDNIYTDWEKY